MHDVGQCPLEMPVSLGKPAELEDLFHELLAFCFKVDLQTALHLHFRGQVLLTGNEDLCESWMLMEMAQEASCIFGRVTSTLNG